MFGPTKIGVVESASRHLFVLRNVAREFGLPASAGFFISSVGTKALLLHLRPE